ncbi:NAD(P)-binding protein [Ramaria rubella]|nr:NAD(P)-binding protein [Ramaria rubella]
MPARLQNKVAIITGAGSYENFARVCFAKIDPCSSYSGIGLESSILFASEGASVVLADINVQTAEHTASHIAKSYPNAKTLVVKADVGKEADIKRLVEATVKEFGRLDVMVDLEAVIHSGIMHPNDSTALDTEEGIWDLTMQINLKGVWWGCKHAIIAMRNNPVDPEKGLNKGGSIINTASFVAIMGAATPQLAYTASKGGVLAMSRELAMVHAKEGIRVNSLCPGPLKTPLLMDFLDTPEKRQRRLIHLPMGRFGEAIELARSALFLASDDSSYITGTDFAVDGGLSACYVTSEGEPVLPPPQSLAPQHIPSFGQK